MRNKRGRSPLGEAILNNKPACAELLVDAGAKMSNVNQSIALSIALISMSLTSLGTLRSICSVRRAYLTLDWLAEKTCVLAPMRDYMYDSCTLLPSHCTTLYVGVGLAPPPIPRQNRGKTGIFWLSFLASKPRIMVIFRFWSVSPIPRQNRTQNRPRHRALTLH